MNAYLEPATVTRLRNEIATLHTREAEEEGLSPPNRVKLEGMKKTLKSAGLPWWEGDAVVMDFDDDEPVKAVTPPTTRPARRTIARTYQRDGRAASGTSRGNLTQVTLGFPPTLLHNTRRFAYRNGLSFAEAVRRLVREGLRT